MTEFHSTWWNALEDIISPSLGGNWEFETKDKDLLCCFVLEAGYCQKDMIAKSEYYSDIVLKKGSAITGVIFCPYDLELTFFIDGKRGNLLVWTSLLELSLCAENY